MAGKEKITKAVVKKMLLEEAGAILEEVEKKKAAQLAKGTSKKVAKPLINAEDAEMASEVPKPPEFGNTASGVNVGRGGTSPGVNAEEATQKMSTQIRELGMLPPNAEVSPAVNPAAEAGIDAWGSLKSKGKVAGAGAAALAALGVSTSANRDPGAEIISSGQGETPSPTPGEMPKDNPAGLKAAAEKALMPAFSIGPAPVVEPNLTKYDEASNALQRQVDELKTVNGIEQEKTLSKQILEAKKELKGIQNEYIKEIRAEQNLAEKRRLINSLAEVGESIGNGIALMMAAREGRKLGLDTVSGLKLSQIDWNARDNQISQDLSDRVKAAKEILTVRQSLPKETIEGAEVKSLRLQDRAAKREETIQSLQKEQRSLMVDRSKEQQDAAEKNAAIKVQYEGMRQRADEAQKNLNMQQQDLNIKIEAAKAKNSPDLKDLIAAQNKLDKDKTEYAESIAAAKSIDPEMLKMIAKGEVPTLEDHFDGNVEAHKSFLQQLKMAAPILFGKQVEQKFQQQVPQTPGLPQPDTAGRVKVIDTRTGEAKWVPASAVPGLEEKNLAKRAP